MTSVDRALWATRLDRLVTYRLSSTGLVSLHWAERLGELDRSELMRAVIEAVGLVIPDWEAERPTDLRPRHALDAARAWLEHPSDEARAHARAMAKACTAARTETFGQGHRVPEAARAVARAAGALDGEHLFDALEAVEAELLARVALVGEYERGVDQRRAIVDALRRVLVPPLAEAAPTIPEPVPVDTTPVPYAASAHFTLGQHLDHKKFGRVVVIAVDETWIEVELADGSRKRLAHKPK